MTSLISLSFGILHKASNYLFYNLFSPEETLEERSSLSKELEELTQQIEKLKLFKTSSSEKTIEIEGNLKRIKTEASTTIAEIAAIKIEIKKESEKKTEPTPSQSFNFSSFSKRGKSNETLPKSSLLPERLNQLNSTLSLTNTQIDSLQTDLATLLESRLKNTNDLNIIPSRIAEITTRNQELATELKRLEIKRFIASTLLTSSVAVVAVGLAYQNISTLLFPFSIEVIATPPELNGRF